MRPSEKYRKKATRTARLLEERRKREILKNKFIREIKDIAKELAKKALQEWAKVNE